MEIDILTVAPGLLDGPFSHSILKRAQEKGILSIKVHDLRRWAINKHGQVDDYQYGGGAGMVMLCQPIADAISALKKEKEYAEVIYLTPDGKTFDQKTANQLSLKGNLLMICGHYKGIDHRLRELFVTMEISIGDFVLSGGELAAAVVVDAVARLLPGAIGDETSALLDSFQDNLLAPPVYSRPAEFMGLHIPPVLLSGNQKSIDDWRYEQSLERTRTIRPDLLDRE